MIDLCKQLVGPEKWPPALEDGVRHSKYTVIDGVIGWVEAGCQILRVLVAAVAVRETQHTRTKVSQLRQKSLSAIMPTASPSCAWTFGGTPIMRPMISRLIVSTSVVGSL